ncbi:MAG: hypothetical protein KDK78_06215, partial [Chlamydiia bacterium]|nr:hypothetical protein [Chlamydiia bacterium]
GQGQGQQSPFPTKPYSGYSPPSATYADRGVYVASVVPIVESVAQAEAVGYAAPVLFDRIFYLFHQVHRLWCWNRQIQYATGSAVTFKQLVAGYVTQLVIGDRLVLKVAAQSVLIAKRIVETAEHQVAFCKAGRRALDALCARHVLVVPSISTPNLLQNPLCAFLSPSTVAWLGFGAHNILYYFGDVLHSFLELGFAAFRLSMSLMDLTLASTLSVNSQSEAVQEFYINTARLMQDLAENRELLKASMDEYRPIIEKLLKQCDSRYTFEDLTYAVDRTAEGSGKAYEVVSKVAELTEDHAKNGLYALCMSLWGDAPNFLIPRRMREREMKQLIPRSHYANHSDHHASWGSRGCEGDGARCRPDAYAHGER